MKMMHNFVENLRQEAEMFMEEGKKDTSEKIEELAYYIESLEHTIREIEIAVMTGKNPIESGIVLAPIKLQDKRMREWEYGTWSPGSDGKRPMTGILELKKR